jgi:hypothetical protein
MLPSREHWKKTLVLAKKSKNRVGFYRRNTFFANFDWQLLSSKPLPKMSSGGGGSHGRYASQPMGNAKINHPSRNLVDLMAGELNIAANRKS